MTIIVPLAVVACMLPVYGAKDIDQNGNGGSHIEEVKAHRTYREVAALWALVFKPVAPMSSRATQQINSISSPKPGLLTRPGELKSSVSQYVAVPIPSAEE